MPTVSEVLTEVDTLKAQLDSLRPLPKEQEDRIMQKFRYWWTYHSNAMEGNVLTQVEAEVFLMEGLTAKGKPLNDHLDLRGHNLAINSAIHLTRMRQPLSDAVIRDLHKTLMVESLQAPTGASVTFGATETGAQGQLRTEPNPFRAGPVEAQATSMPGERAAQLEALTNWYAVEAGRGQRHLVELVAQFHQQFVAIHPFSVGNGPMARLLMNLLLMQVGYPPVIIRVGERETFMTTMRHADNGKGGDYLNFIATHVLKSLEIFLRELKGEDVQEPTDLDSEIEQLKIVFSELEEPVPLTQPIQKQLFESSIAPLFAEVRRAVQPLLDLFFEEVLFWTCRYGTDQVDKIHSAGGLISDPQSTPHMNGNWSGVDVVKYLEIKYDLKGFKKYRLDNFDVNNSLQIKFDPLMYDIRLKAPTIAVRHYYQEPLGRDEIANFAQGLTKHLVDSIKKNTGTRL